MELKLKDGDYIPDGAGGVEGSAGAEEVLSRVLFRLTARRGALPFLPELGSDLYKILRERTSARQAAAKQYVAQALEGEQEVTVTDVAVAQVGEGAQVRVELDWRGEALSVTARV